MDENHGDLLLALTTPPGRMFKLPKGLLVIACHSHCLCHPAAPNKNFLCVVNPHYFSPITGASTTCPRCTQTSPSLANKLYVPESVSAVNLASYVIFRLLIYRDIVIDCNSNIIRNKPGNKWLEGSPLWSHELL